MQISMPHVRFSCARACSISLMLLVIGMVLHLFAGETVAHAGLSESDPPANAILAETPHEVTMRFTEPLEWSYTTSELYNASGEIVANTEVREGSDEYEMVLALPDDLPRGSNTVLWRTLSTVDGHPAQNYFAFTVGTAGDVTSPSTVDTAIGADQPPLSLQALARWSALLGLAGAVAIWPVWLFVLRPANVTTARQMDHRMARSARRFAVIVLAAALAGNVIALAVQAATLSEGSYTDNLVTTIVETRFGRLWLARLALLGLLAEALRRASWRVPWRRPALSVAALVASASLVLPFSLVAHASAQPVGQTSALLTDVLHLLGASIWAGGLFTIVAVGLPTVRAMPAIDRRRSLSILLRRFSTMALVAWSAMVSTGVYSAWLQVGSLDALLNTDYGNTLLVKLALLVPALVLATFNLIIVTSSLERYAEYPSRIATWTRRFILAVGFEVLLVVAVLGAVGTLSAQSPAREADVAESDTLETQLVDGDRSARLSLYPGAPGPNEMTLTFNNAEVSHDTDILLRMESEEEETGQKQIALEHDAEGAYTYQGTELSLPGEWELELIVRPPDAAEWRAYGTVTLATGAPERNPPEWVLSSVGGTIGIAFIVIGMGGSIVGYRLREHPYRRHLVTAGLVAILLGSIVATISRTDGPQQLTTIITSFATV